MRPNGDEERREYWSEADLGPASRRVLAWAPGLVDPSDAEATDLLPRIEADTLGDIDLSTAPVSVTPPSSWRKAAWFTVAASVVVLVVLVFAAARLASPEHRFMDAFPGIPTGGLLTPHQLPGGELTTSTALGAGESKPDSPGAPAQGNGELPSATELTDGNAPPGGRSGSDGEDQSNEATTSTAPTTQRPGIDSAAMRTATRQFFDALPENTQAAWQMMGPRLRGRGYQHFVKQWTKTDDVQLQDVVVIEDDSSVVATVEVINSDGTRHGQIWLLSFRYNNKWLLIDDAELLNNGTGDGNQPYR